MNTSMHRGAHLLGPKNQVSSVTTVSWYSSFICRPKMPDSDTLAPALGSRRQPGLLLPRMVRRLLGTVPPAAMMAAAGSALQLTLRLEQVGPTVHAGPTVPVAVVSCCNRLHCNAVGCREQKVLQSHIADQNMLLCACCRFGKKCRSPAMYCAQATLMTMCFMQRAVYMRMLDNECRACAQLRGPAAYVKCASGRTCLRERALHSIAWTSACKQCNMLMHNVHLVKRNTPEHSW